MATMADVARHAGVSVATVSHVLNDTRVVRPATRQAVLDAIEVLGYTPNTLARSLVTARTRSIGLAVSAISNPYFTEILQGVEAGALEHGYSLLIADPHDDPEHERKVVQLLHERRVDGMIVAPSADPGRPGRLPDTARRTDGVPGPAARHPLGQHPALRPGVRRERRAHGPADGSPRRTRPQAHRPGRGPPRSQHDGGTDHRLPHRPRVRRAAPRRAPGGPWRLRVGGCRAGHRRPALPRGAADRPRHRQQRDDHRRPARPARAGPHRAGRPGAVLLRRLRLGRPLHPGAHRDRAARQGDRRPGRTCCSWTAWPTRTARPGPCGSRPRSSIASRADVRPGSTPRTPARPRKDPSHDRRRR